MGPNVRVDLAFTQRDVQSVGPHRLDVCGPLIDEHDVELVDQQIERLWVGAELKRLVRTVLTE